MNAPQANPSSRPGKTTTPVVQVRLEEIVIPTYMPAPPDKNPMFLEKRVYQGSSGRVYPLPFTDRIEETRTDRKWKAVWIENEFLRAMVLPEIGGRIHVLQDKSNGYDLIYNQPIVKPALVGLAGPWISGGIEFNWPQHHRPATFMPVDFEIEELADGSKIVWCSDHDPMSRMKGMHGVCLHPGKAYLELKVRAYNRTPFVQTFLWWANVATQVHEAYRSFFPPDVYYVADHARRSTSEYPLAQGFYYGVNYGERGLHGVPESETPAKYRPPHLRPNGNSGDPLRDSNLPDYTPNDLTYYANIPTPCSYMCMGSKEDFFGGYDYAARAGIVHFADHHISPGKKQWTWGNHEFGYAWDRNLTDKSEQGAFPPYIEIMAGVYTDNQPDFSFLQPGETKVWSQYWYPIREIGPARHATLDAAISLQCAAGKCRLGVAVTAPQPQAIIRVRANNKTLRAWTRDLSPASPMVQELSLPTDVTESDLQIEISEQNGRKLLSHQVKPRVKADVPPPAAEPPPPDQITSIDELYITGLHLEQYRHATRCPTLYWREALRRDPGDARCNNALGLWQLRRGEFGLAEDHFRKAIERLTLRNANPYDGEPHYNLGLCLRYLGRDDDAYAAFYKATWNQAWVAAAAHALAEIDCSREDWTAALSHLELSLRFNTDNLRARDLKAMVLKKTGLDKEASALMSATLDMDPLDWWSRHQLGKALTCDLQAALDLALDYARAGLLVEAVELLRGVRIAHRKAVQSKNPLPDQSWGAVPLIHYYLGWLYQQLGDQKTASAEFKMAGELAPDYCFPARLEEIGILQAAIQANPADAHAPYYLGNLFYDRRRHEEGIRMWEQAARLDPTFSTVWRNIGIGCFNVRHQPAKARAAYEKAFQANPADARLLFERDQLWKRLSVSPRKRLAELERHLDLVQMRDDLSVELCALYNQVGEHQQALDQVSSRHFQPWEGGEGGPLGQHVRSHVALGRMALAEGESAVAREHFEAALCAPANLGEAKHLLTNQSDIHYWLGRACESCNDTASACRHWEAAATFKGDFQEMSVRSFSEMTYFSALSWMKLGRQATGRKMLKELLAHAAKLEKAPATIDYFATSLPTMLLFDDNLPFRQQTTALFLQAQARLGLGDKPTAKRLIHSVLRRDPNHALAADLLNEF